MTARSGGTLLQDAGRSVWAYKSYVSASRKAAFLGPGKFWGVMRKAPKGGALHPIHDDINRIIAMLRARVEHPFRVIKRQFGYVKTRYRGLGKNRVQLFTLFALGNLFLVRRKFLSSLDVRLHYPFSDFEGNESGEITSR